MLNRYAFDTFSRIREFDNLRKPVYHSAITGDSRTVDILRKWKNKVRSFPKL